MTVCAPLHHGMCHPFSKHLLFSTLDHFQQTPLKENLLTLREVLLSKPMRWREIKPLLSFKSTWENSQWNLIGLKDPFLFNVEATITGSLILSPSILPTHPLTKTLMMRIEVLEEEGIQGMTLMTSRLRHRSLMAISNRKQKIISIGYRPLKGSLNERSTTTKRLSSWLSLQ